MIRQPHPNELEKLVSICVEHANDAGLIEHDQLDRSHSKQQLKQMMISPDYKIFVYEYKDKFAGYIVGNISQKLWNKTLYGEIVLYFVHPEVRNKHIADDLFNAVEDWFVENGCQYQQASCLMYDSDYKANETWLHRSTTYLKTRHMNEVGYHYVKKLETNEWVA